jgi:hypothetical protein
MKRIQILTLMLACIALPSFAKTLEFRRFTLEPAKGQKPLTVEQINDAINQNQLGQDKAVKIPVENGKFSYVDINSIRFASEYNNDLTIAKYDSKDLGVIITGTTKKVDKYVEVTFSYNYTTKLKDVIYGAKNMRAILMPTFKSLGTSCSVIVELTNNQWQVRSISPGSESQTYIAFRILNK